MHGAVGRRGWGACAAALLATCALLAAAAEAGAGAPIGKCAAMQNGDFELGTLTGWTFTCDPCNLATNPLCPACARAVQGPCLEDGCLLTCGGPAVGSCAPGVTCCFFMGGGPNCNPPDSGSICSSVAPFNLPASGGGTWCAQVFSGAANTNPCGAMNWSQIEQSFLVAPPLILSFDFAASFLSLGGPSFVRFTVDVVGGGFGCSPAIVFQQTVAGCQGWTTASVNLCAYVGCQARISCYAEAGAGPKAYGYLDNVRCLPCTATPTATATSCSLLTQCFQRGPFTVCIPVQASCTATVTPTSCSAATVCFVHPRNPNWTICMPVQATCTGTPSVTGTTTDTATVTATLTPVCTLSPTAPSPAQTFTFISDTQNQRWVIVQTNGTFGGNAVYATIGPTFNYAPPLCGCTTFATGSQVVQPKDMEVAPDGNLLAVDAEKVMLFHNFGTAASPNFLCVWLGHFFSAPACPPNPPFTTFSYTLQDAHAVCHYPQSTDCNGVTTAPTVLPFTVVITAQDVTYTGATPNTCGAAATGQNLVAEIVLPSQYDGVNFVCDGTIKWYHTPCEPPWDCFLLEDPGACGGVQTKALIAEAGQVEEACLPPGYTPSGTTVTCGLGSPSGVLTTFADCSNTTTFNVTTGPIDVHRVRDSPPHLTLLSDAGNDAVYMLLHGPFLAGPSVVFQYGFPGNPGFQPGYLDDPTDAVAVGPMTGNLPYRVLVSDSGNCRAIEFDPTEFNCQVWPPSPGDPYGFGIVGGVAGWPGCAPLGTPPGAGWWQAGWPACDTLGCGSGALLFNQPFDAKRW